MIPSLPWGACHGLDIHAAPVDPRNGRPKMDLADLLQGDLCGALLRLALGVEAEAEKSSELKAVIQWMCVHKV